MGEQGSAQGNGASGLNATTGGSCCVIRSSLEVISVYTEYQAFSKTRRKACELALHPDYHGCDQHGLWRAAPKGFLRGCRNHRGEI